MRSVIETSPMNEPDRKTPVAAIALHRCSGRAMSLKVAQASGPVIAAVSVLLQPMAAEAAQSYTARAALIVTTHARTDAMVGLEGDVALSSLPFRAGGTVLLPREAPDVVGLRAWGQWDAFRRGEWRVGLQLGVLRPFGSPTCAGFCSATLVARRVTWNVSVPITWQPYDQMWLRFTPTFAPADDQYITRLLVDPNALLLGPPPLELGWSPGNFELSLRLAAAPIAIGWRF